MKQKQPIIAVDLFFGCGGLSEGLKQAGFKVIAGVEVNKNAAKAYRMNHSDTVLFEDDIRILKAPEKFAQATCILPDIR